MYYFVFSSIVIYYNVLYVLTMYYTSKHVVSPFLTQSDLSVENGLFLLMKPKSGFLTQSKKGFFDSTFSTEFFRLENPVEKLDFFD